MVSALSRKSITDLSRRRSRTFFSVVTLALAVASIGLFALPALMNRAMHAAVTSDRLPDLTVYTRPLRLDGAQLAALATPAERARRRAALVLRRPGVRGLPPCLRAGPRRAGLQPAARRCRARRVGRRAADRRGADGRAEREPGAAAGRAGAIVRIIGADGTVRRLRRERRGAQPRRRPVRDRRRRDRALRDRRRWRR